MDNRTYETFLHSGQARLRLQAALEGFLSAGEPEEEHLAEYAAYLKRRIRPAMELLIEQQDLPGMERLEAMGWFGAAELEGFLRTAREKQKTEALVWLMKLKDEKYGYRQDEFEL